ncbi:MAG: KamA family radical SAM protein [Chlamydiota bacterium]
MPWRTVQRQNFTRIDDLLNFLEMSEPLRAEVWQKPRFPLNLPLRLARKIAKNTLNDPILRQFLPLKEEAIKTPGFMIDPVADATFRKANKLLVKYKERALLATTSACAMNCRFCFRQNFDYATDTKGFEEELSLIAEDPSLSEIILSGGDPLSLSNDVLKALINDLSAIPHIKLLRFHSRFPIGIPERIDTEFLDILKNTRLQPIFILHSNHPQELDDDIFTALNKLQILNIPILNQTVLLKGVNDDVETLKELMLKLVCHGIIPYYLHQLDKVQGTAHFEVPQEKGKSLVQSLRECLPGYAIPRYVREIPGHPNKTLL